MSDEDLVKIAANKYGFNLEFKNKHIFEKNDFVTRHDTLMKLNEELLEIDRSLSLNTCRFIAID